MKIKIHCVIAGLLIMAGLVFAYPSNPPQPLHKVGDHWTPYDPPTEFPEGVDVYIIQPGETLWGLAEQKLGDPFLWPQIWEGNTYITDSHWIYPGDPLVLTPVSVEEVPQESYEEQAPVEEAPPEPAESREAGPDTTPIPLGFVSDMECFFKVTPTDVTYPITILGTDDGSMKYTMTEGQIVYISAGSEDGIQAGDIYSIAQDRGVIKDDSGTELGHAWLLHGKITVLCTQEKTSTARITMACDSILRGFHILPYELIPIPTNIPQPFQPACMTPTGKVQGKILMAADDSFSFAQGSNVLISLGIADGIEAGQYIRVYRDLSEEGHNYVVQGRLGVLETFDHTSNCKILESVRELHPGDLVELEQ